MQVAESYKNYKYDESKAYEKSGKLYVLASMPCDRCVKGVFISHVENGQLVPHPAYNGVCLKCEGSGILKKEIRLYTDEEFAKMKKYSDAAKEKRVEAAVAKKKREYAGRLADWKKKECFNENDITYVYFKPDSFDVKDQLKEAGFRFNPTLFWHIAEVPAQFKDSCFEVRLDEVATISSFGYGNYNRDAVDLIKTRIKQANPETASHSDYIFPNDGNKFRDISVVCTGKMHFDGAYGTTTMFTFEDEDENVIVWYTSSNPDIQKGDAGFLTGTFKVHKEYKGIKQTVVTRVKFI